MNKEQYVEYIKSLLGGGVVNIELEEDISKFVDLALLKVKPYINSTNLMTLPSAQSIDLSKDSVYSVTAVYRGAPLLGTNSYSADSDSNASTPIVSDAVLYSPNLYNYSNELLGVTSVGSITISMLTRQVLGQIYGRGGDIEYYYDYNTKTLYLELSGVECTEITIEYIPEYSDVTQVADPFWVNIILGIAMALTKIALGRARGKYHISNLPYELDGDTLVSEGKEELNSLEEKLDELKDVNCILD